MICIKGVNEFYIGVNDLYQDVNEFYVGVNDLY